MDSFFENAQHIFDVARSASGDACDQFGVFIRPDGGLHFVMESPLSLEAASTYCSAHTAYLVTRSASEIRVHGRNSGLECLLEERKPALTRRSLLRDQPLYRITSPLLTSSTS